MRFPQQHLADDKYHTHLHTLTFIGTMAALIKMLENFSDIITVVVNLVKMQVNQVSR